MRVCVTGAAGFIGSHIGEECVKKGWEVLAVDNMVAGKRENLGEWWNPKLCTFLSKDVQKLTEEDLEGVEVIFHEAASKATVCRTNPFTDLMTNARGTLHIATLACQVGAKVIHASTGSVYGNRGSLANEYDRPAPVSFYGVSKLAGEGYLAAMREYNPNFEYTILRYHHVYGPRQNSEDGLGGVVAIFIRRILENKPLVIYGNGKQIRHFTYVKDVVEANIAMASRKAEGGIYNVACRERWSIRELAKLVTKQMDAPFHPVVFEPQRPGDIPIFKVATDRLDRTGCKCSTKLDEGLAATIEWHRGQEGCQRTEATATG